MPNTEKNTERLFDLDPYQKSMDAQVIFAEGERILLDRTVFYPTGGGQAGDTGTLVVNNGVQVNVIDTLPDSEFHGLIWHVLDSANHELHPGMQVTGNLDWNRRYKIMQMHTCLHVLSAIIDAPVTGCSIKQDGGRLDFDIPSSSLIKSEVTEQLKKRLATNAQVLSRQIDISEYFRYETAVKTKNVSPPLGKGPIRIVEIEAIDLQPCGGTHVKSLAEVSAVFCRKIEKKSKSNRRISLSWCQ